MKNPIISALRHLDTREKKLAFKLILYIFTSAALIFSVAFLYNYNISEKIVKKNLKINAEHLTVSTVHEIDKILGSAQKIPDNFSRIVESSDFSKPELIAILKMMVENNPEIYGAALALEPWFIDSSEKLFAPYFYKTNGKIKYTTLTDESYNYFTMDWYQIPKELNKPMWSEPYFDEGGGNVLMSTYSVPLHRTINETLQFVGILTIDISLDWLQKMVSEIKVYETGYSFLISGNGAMISHPNRDLIINESLFTIADAQKSSELHAIGRNMIHGKSSFAEFSYRNLMTGKLSWIAYAPLATNNWSLGVVFPVEEFMADANNLFINLIYLGIGGLVIMLVVIIVISRSITRPLRSLTQATGRFALGDFSVALPKIKSRDEIGRLNTSFIYMQETLDKTMSDLRKASENLKISNEELEEVNRNLEQKVNERTAELNNKNKELDVSFNNLRRLNEIGRKITSTLDFNEIQEMVYDQVKDLLGASCFLIMIYNQEMNILECNMSVENGNKLPPFGISMEEKNRFPVWCVENSSPVFMNDVDKEYKDYVPERATPVKGKSVASLIYLPLMIEKRVLGVISTQSFSKNAYSRYQFDMLNNLANFIAIAFDNALSYEKINKANNDLKAAQAQLVQAEKMASLGQLTAGIAHEIKNPLNFVNNFSELSVDLADELKEEIEKLSDYLNQDDLEYLKEITGDIRSNVNKINEHGKRADSIVKGMLLHSRGKAGEKQPTDINSVLKEYVNLGYHGMRAQNPDFNIKIDAIYDDTLELVNVVPQNISRVFLNIINNACYSTLEKKNQLKDAYFPILAVRTLNHRDKVEVIIRDNGKGIPHEILDKIFNPFFTTKPPGKGTGLGLSLSYDIIVQEHCGEMLVDSEEGEYAEFRIIIPKACDRAAG